MNKMLSFEEIKSAIRHQPFDLVENAKSEKIELADLVLMPNQFAYSVNCQTAELERVVGNTQILGLINQDFKSIDVFYELVHPQDVALYVNTTLNNFEFMLGDAKKCLPMRNLFSMSYRARKVNAGHNWVKRDTFASESYKGIVSKTIGIITMVPFMAVSHRQPQCFGPDSRHSPDSPGIPGESFE